MRRSRRRSEMLSGSMVWIWISMLPVLKGGLLVSNS
jgi:hypothetical protein